MKIIFATHPEVDIDPAIDVPRWHLTDKGIARMRAFSRLGLLDDTAAVWASTEAKAIEGAGIVAARFGLPVQVDKRLDENDRSATGYLAQPLFLPLVEAFFAQPTESVQGWETAADAQTRVAGAFKDIAANLAGDTVIVGHGGTGTLLWCYLSGQPIARRHDQPYQGHYWVYDARSRAMIQDWTPIAPV